MTHTEKDAVVRAALAYQSTYGGVLPNFAVEQIASHAGIAPRSLRRWIADYQARAAEPASASIPKTPSTDEAGPHRKGNPFEIDEDHLTAVRSVLNLKAAHALLWPEEHSPGRVSYPTFARAFKNLPPSIREGILHGWDAMGRHQVYLSMTAPHRNHTWHLDWTQADVWVSLSRAQVVRPWIGIVRDNATSMRLAAVAYAGRPNEDAMCDLLATAATTREYVIDGETIPVGGLPVQLVLDNAREHFAEAVTRGAVMLGVVIAPTKAFYKHQNGPAESTFSGLNKQLLAALPAYTKGGNGDDGQPLLCPSTPDEIDPDMVLTMESLQKHLDQWLETQNVTTRLVRLGDQPPLVAWRDDPTEVTPIAEETVRAMMMRASFDRAINGEGIRFRGVDYLAPELNAYRETGAKVTVRYLSRETRFIEVFDGDTWICRAFDRRLLTETQRQAILRNRERDLDLLKRINAAAVQDRRHQHATGDEAAYDGDMTTEQQAAVDDAVSNVTALDFRRDRTEPRLEQNGEPAEAVEIDRVDPTTPQRLKRQVAPSRTKAEEKRRIKKIQHAKERISKRPGSNFGGINDD
ncbi:Mu transposase C-terminal domain-containing protein [Trujillonella endophytica]|uniref:Mu transposase, C-terminal n=1 Tax=Trujillonella endophytica TaxID=673521 RepID=A0A1H8VI57_9ACTN|nr:Mu transposase C-terminal domain-containing protein [Trujillella endophytica]SEP14980.1 Mu transposase, C-terminal [Trujillella endophytica]